MYCNSCQGIINKDDLTYCEQCHAPLHKSCANHCLECGKTLCDIEPYVSVGTRIYTLPEKEGSRFSLKGGKLNFIADNPYGNDKGDKRFWDDYNVNIDKSYSPLKLKWKKTGNKDYDDNR